MYTLSRETYEAFKTSSLSVVCNSWSPNTEGLVPDATRKSAPYFKIHLTTHTPCKIHTHARKHTSNNTQTEANMHAWTKEKNIPHIMHKYTSVQHAKWRQVEPQTAKRLHWDWGQIPLHTKQAGTDGNLRAKHTPRACMHVCVRVCVLL